MSARIRRLSRAVVDRIAAGEVVERPAAVVKELVENALDAGATRVDVEVRGGGRDLVLVRDDGVGMGPDDLRLALESHATSKLADVGDLDHIASFGFRGEALASIGAVADCRIVSRERGGEHGYEIACAGGERTEPAAAAGPEGTRVEVRHLFKYVPARRKFLRSAGTELSHVTAVLQRLALANPDVAFSLARDGRRSFAVGPADDRRRRLARFYGPELDAALLPVSGHEDGLRLDGYVARPEAARATARWQHLFLNGRPIRDRRVLHAVRHAFEGLLTVGRQPVVFLFLEMDPADVDVNVHPAKSEVRFRDGERVHRLVRRAVRDALLAADLSPNVLRVSGAVGTPDHGSGPARYIEGVKEALAGFLERDPVPHSTHATLFAPSGRRGAGEPEPDARPRPVLRYLQMADLFLVFEDGDGLVVVDQHALHERILLEELHERLRTGTLEVQPLLVPAVVELPAADAELLLDAATQIERLGIRLASFGETAVGVHALPAMLADSDPARLIAGLVERLQAEGAGATAGHRADLFEPLLHSMACRAAIMAGDRLTEEQATELMRRADLLDTSQTCAHGRPTSLRLPFDDLRRHFGR